MEKITPKVFFHKGNQDLLEGSLVRALEDSDMADKEKKRFWSGFHMTSDSWEARKEYLSRTIHFGPEIVFE